MFPSNDVKEDQNILHVRICQQPSRRFLTVVEGIPEENCPMISETLKRKLACRGTHIKNKKTVEFSGDHSYNIKEMLQTLMPGYQIIIHGKK
ncbi:hypothetical protein H312_01092 [Anncaliia algerae PRA339]|uniref:SUI1 domain-containing protein n=2 Tax=Opisthokonta TaxID=33154 RepID=A0A059F3F2_9MICR|nr:hypothetical protein H312_01092 [Anncaliia algerae PRA339]